MRAKTPSKRLHKSWKCYDEETSTLQANYLHHNLPSLVGPCRVVTLALVYCPPLVCSLRRIKECTRICHPKHLSAQAPTIPLLSCRRSDNNKPNQPTSVASTAEFRHTSTLPGDTCSISMCYSLQGSRAVGLVSSQQTFSFVGDPHLGKVRSLITLVSLQ